MYARAVADEEAATRCCTTVSDHGLDKEQAAAGRVDRAPSVATQGGLDELNVATADRERSRRHCLAVCLFDAAIGEPQLATFDPKPTEKTQV